MAIVREAEKWLGTPYCYGGLDNHCTDCSGFVLQVFSTVGVVLPRTASDQFEYATNVNEDNMQPGDLVFFQHGSGIAHVGIYVGNNEFIHASTSRGVVRQSLDDEYYRTTYAGCRTLF